MPQPADDSLLLGVMAVQMRCITADALLRAVEASAARPGRSVAEVLVDEGSLDPLDRDALRPLVDRQVARHGGDPAAGVGALVADDPSLCTLGNAADFRTLGVGVPGEPGSTRGVEGADADLDPGSGGIPRYRRLRLHARGNIGEVYLARDEELNREVALKQIQERNADDPGSRGRFCFEAEVTGALEHPGIVPVYGLSRDARGRPYYAMQFIQGRSLAAAIAAHHAQWAGDGEAGTRMLALRKLLRSFLDVCNAVAYAHSRGFIHRDLKPANIMLGRFAETLVVDWGLARPIDAGAADEAPAAPDQGRPDAASGSDFDATTAGSVVGTPAYMAPEQAEGRLDRLGATSDVYSLGATLYQILTGRAPFTVDGPGRLLDRVRRGEFPGPRAVAPTVPRALEAITLKAMALDPADRYPTPLALAADVEHWLADEPIAAAPERLGEKLGRWGRRHRTASLAAAAALLGITLAALAAIGVVARYQGQTQRALDSEMAAKHKVISALGDARRAGEAERLAKQAALTEAEKARTVAAFLVGLFEEVDPIAAAGRTFGFAGQAGAGLGALDVVDRGAKALETQLRDRPPVRAAILDAIGTVYVSLGAGDRARPLLDEALAIRRLDPTAAPLDLAASLHALGWARLGQLDPASVDLLRQALELRRAHLPADDPRVAATMFLLAMALTTEEGGSTAESDRLLADSLAIRQRRLGENSREVGVQYAFMGYMLAVQGDYGRAGPLFLKAALVAIANGEGRMAGVFAGYAKAEAVHGAFGGARALPAYAQCVEGAIKAFGPDHLVTTFFTMTYGDRLLRAHKPAEAERQYRACLESLRRLRALDEAGGAVVLNLARALRDQRRYPEAEAEARRALAIFRGARAVGASRGGRAQACWVLAMLIWGDGKSRDEALGLLAEAADTRRDMTGPDSMGYAEATFQLARHREEAGQIANAATSYAEVARIARLHPDDTEHPWLREAQAHADRLRAR